MREKRVFRRRRAVYLGLLTAFACILSYVETLIPFHFAVPGMKLGLANAAILSTLYLLSVRDAFLLSFIRIFIVGLLFGNLYSVAFSAAGALASLFLMTVLKRTNLFSMTGVSIGGGVGHNLGQIAAAVLLLDMPGFFYYLPVLAVAGAVTGGLIGVTAGEIRKRIKIDKEQL